MSRSLTITLEDYDEILDALDNEDTNTIIKRFQAFDLEPDSELVDAPRLGNNYKEVNIELNTYLDYVIYYNLTNIIDIFIDNFNLGITDDTLSKCLTLHNHDTYNYLCNLGYIPESETFKKAVHLCCSKIVDSILSNDSDLIKVLDDEDIEYIYNYNIDEETIETVRVLFNYDVEPSIFSEFLFVLREYDSNANIDFNSNNSNNEDIEDIILELIDILETNNVK